jgi:hypothetical protein
MKYVFTVLSFFLIIQSCSKKADLPRVIITSDIQLCCNDPDDIQSLCHLLWYADELDIRGIIPDNFDRGQEPGGITAAEQVLNAYRLDYNDTTTNFKEMGYPAPDHLFTDVLQTERDSAIRFIIDEALKKDKRPLYILVWGSMNILKDALLAAPEIQENIRVLTVGTNLRAPQDGGDGALPNWNGPGRNRIFGDPRFDALWWIENDWGYHGMFKGISYQEEDENPKAGRPYEMMLELAEKGGYLGKHLKDAVAPERTKWAYYFRAGDTPTVLYLIDPDNNLDDPGKGSWAGIFDQPLPDARPHYWTNVTGESGYDHTDPMNTWRFADSAITESFQYMLGEREEMYQSLLDKLKRIYGE